MDSILHFDLDDYEILDLIGQGGMSRVYLAESRSDGEQVAIKILAPQTLLDPKFTTRFEREVRVLSRLRHPNIVPILEYGEVDGFPYIVMPYSRVGTLHDKIASGAIPIDEISSIITDLSGALEYLHDQGIVHRDIKPSNILIDEQGNASLSDFGLVREIDTSQSLTGSVVIGTPAFMSPEQCGGMEISAASDQYALSVVLYLMLTGRIPFEAKTPMAILVKQMHDPVPSPKRYNPEVPMVVEQVLLRGLDKNPERRFASITDFHDAFQAALVESVDPETGGFIPDPLDYAAVTEALPEIEDEEHPGMLAAVWHRLPRSLRMAMALLPVFGVMFLPGIAAWVNGDQGQTLPQETAIPSSIGLQATIEALSTENARSLGFMAFPGQVETAVAGTLQVLEATMNSFATPTVDRFVAGMVSTPSATLLYDFLLSSTDPVSDDQTGGGSNPATTPTEGFATRTATTDPTFTGSASPTNGGNSTPTTIPPTTSNPTGTAQQPSSTPGQATSTSAPPATPTPNPPPTSTAQPPPEPTQKNCRYDRPNHPHYCTPEP